MSEYHKIQTLFKRDMSNRKTLIEGEWTLPEFEYLAGNVWVFTEKVDGTNIRVIFKDGTVTFGGRTADAQIPAQLVTRLNERFLPMAPKLAKVFAQWRRALRRGIRREDSERRRQLPSRPRFRSVRCLVYNAERQDDCKINKWRFSARMWRT